MDGEKTERATAWCTATAYSVCDCSCKEELTKQQLTLQGGKLHNFECAECEGDNCNGVPSSASVPFGAALAAAAAAFQCASANS